jgi:hypothetical protein
MALRQSLLPRFETVRFGDFGIVELLLIGLQLLLGLMTQLGIVAYTHRFTNIDGEPNFGESEN